MDLNIFLLAFSTYLCGFASGAREVKYVSCMKRTSGSLSFKEKVKASNVHVKACVQHCWERRRKFAGLQSGSQCFCSASLNDVVTVAEPECYKRCNKDCQQICGGENTLSVYKTGYIREPAAPMKAQALIKANIGCYDKFRSPTVLCPKTFAPLVTIRMTAQLCVHYCASVYKAKFSTTADKETCCCSNSVGGARNTRLEWCNMHCKGDARKTIGCMGVHRGLVVVATIQLSRLPDFKRWPPSTFTNADWLAPIYPAGENFRIKDKPLTSQESDPSLSGLLAKKLVNQPVVGNSSMLTVAVIGDRAVVSLEGGDKRDKASGGVGKSVAVSEVSGKTEVAEPTKDEGNTIIIVAVVIGFAIIIIATGLYIFRNKNKTDDVESDDDDD